MIDSCRLRLHFFIEPQTEFVGLAGWPESRLVHQAENLKRLPRANLRLSSVFSRSISPKLSCAAGFQKCSLPPLQRFHVLRLMISSGERLMRPSIGLNNVCSHLGKSAVLFPAALALSIGSFFLQPANASKAHIPTQGPTRLRRKMVARFQQCLHRAIIDTSLVNRVARKFSETRGCVSACASPSDHPTNSTSMGTSMYPFSCALVRSL
jgi:hypothetical protein